jgi:outer membrane protein
MRNMLVVFFVLLAGSYAYAEEAVKIGHIDLQRALNESAVGKKAKGELEEMVKLRQAVIGEKVRLKEEKTRELEKQGFALSEDVVMQKEDELKKMDRDIKRMIDDSNVEVQKVQRERERRILKELEVLIAKLGDERGFTIIFPSDVVLYSVDAADLTGDVIRMYDALGSSVTEGEKKEPQ